MDDNQASVPPPMSRRNSIAGPWLRSSSGIPEEFRPAGSAAPNVTPASAATHSNMTFPPPLTRAKTVGGGTTGGWLENWFGRRPSLSSSTTLPRRNDPPQFDEHTQLTSSAPLVKAPKGSSPDPPASELGAGQTPAAQVPPLRRRLSDIGSSQLRNSTVIAASATVTTTTTTVDSPGSSAPSSPNGSRPSLFETDLRQGPIETDLFWLVLRDIGE